jgi:uncharacterized protein YciI
VYVVAILRYRKPLEQILPHVDPHRAYLRELKGKGVLLASGPMDPRHGGVLLLRVPDGTPAVELDRIRDADPFVTAGCCQYELIPWNPVIGKEDLDRV